MRPNGIPLMHTRALGHAYLVPSQGPRVLGQENPKPEQTQGLGPEAKAAETALREAKRLYLATKARHGDLTLFLGSVKADEALGQAAANLEGAKSAFQDAVSRGA